MKKAAGTLDALFQADLRGKIAHWSAAAEHLTGFDGNEAKGRGWIELLDARDRSGRHARETAGGPGGPLKARGKDGRPFWIVPVMLAVRGSKPEAGLPFLLPGDTTKPAPAGQTERVSRRGGFKIPLSPREIEVLRLLADGSATNKVGERLFISVTTVRNHVQAILRKLQLHSKLEAVVYAYRNKIV